ncbi:MAG: T9SS type A sorting domain-containing protein [Bacteroidales bacterium]|nr:T9SS type A sorting domain-containing protein [Bacteroidales bacterium]
MRNFITFIALVCSLTVFGQVGIKKSSIDSGGTSTQSGTTKMIYTIGEVAVQEKTTGSFGISEGFINSDMFNTVGTEELTKLAGVSIFPNPTEDLLTISFENESKYDISISDLFGKLIQNKITDELKAEIHVSHLSPGIYWVLIKDVTNKTYAGYKIIKQ